MDYFNINICIMQISKLSGIFKKSQKYRLIKYELHAYHNASIAKHVLSAAFSWPSKLNGPLIDLTFKSSPDKMDRHTRLLKIRLNLRNLSCNLIMIFNYESYFCTYYILYIIYQMRSS